MRPPPPLVALTPGDLPRRGAPALLGAVRRALEAGLRGLLVREPDCPDGPLLAFVSQVREHLTAFPEAWLALHDRAHLARALELDGLHLGFRSLTPRLARDVFPGGAIGLSTHAFDDRSAWSEADYLFHGPVHPTPSKRGRVEPVGVAGIAAAVSAAPRPLWALGGVTPADLGPLRRAGAAGVAVLSGLLAAPDPAAATRAYLTAWEQAR